MHDSTGRVLATCVLLGTSVLSGCSRTFYRQQADAEAYCLTDQKAAVVGLPPGVHRIEIDPRSRMYDPFDPDCEPMPPDDPKSNLYMQCVDCKKGSRCWRCLPKTPFVENPTWLEYLPRDENGAVPMDIRGAVGLGLLHSSDYQEELEDLYLSALDVSFERFRFDTQFFGGSDILFTADGRDRTGSGNSSSLLEVSPLSPSSRLRAERLTATGGELVVGFANSLVWQFAGPDDYSSNTIIDFSLVQPLLRRAGRTRVLERLTISERTLLANVRQMERFRRGFYLSVVTGESPGQGPSRRGGFFGGAGLEGFSGVGGGGFGGVGSFGFGGSFGGTGGGVTGGAGAQGAGGYLGLLQNIQTLRNQRANVIALRESAEQLQASYEAGRIDRFQVDLAQQALYNAQSQLLSSENTYQARLENFKVEFGLPPELPVSLTDPILARFNLLSPELEAVKQDVSETLAVMRQRRDGVDVEVDMDWAALKQLLRESVEQQLGAVQGDLENMDAALPKRRELLQRLASREELQEAQIDKQLFDPEQLDARAASRHEEFANLEVRLAEAWQVLDRIPPDANSWNDEQLRTVVDTLTGISGGLLELTLVQAAARLEAISFEPIELQPEQALRIASAYRRDWQNARARLVDIWRLIYFNANDLLSDLDIVFSGDIGNVSDNPFDLRDSRGRLRVGLQFDAPLTRVAERNIYRQSLIEYQQARRDYYRFRDRVYQDLRNTLRQLRLNEINFELRRAAVLVAVSQVDLTQLRLSEPPKPGAEAQFGNTTARDLVQSLTDLLNVQNDFLSVWVNYEVQRLSLEFDLGVMQLDPNGMRMENPMNYADYLAELDCRLANPEASSGSSDEAEEIPLRLPDGVAPPAEVLPPPQSGPSGPLLQQPASEIILTTYEQSPPVSLPPIAPDGEPVDRYTE